MADQEVVTPSDIAPLKDKLIEAVINAYMCKRIPETSDLYLEDQDDHESSCDAGEFRYKQPAPDNVFGFSLEKDIGYYVSYPGGHWTEDVSLLPDIDAPRNLFDANAVYELCRAEVSKWIDPWVETCPSPNEFENQINSIANVASQLYIGNEVVFGSGGSSSSDGASSPTSAVSDLRSAVDEIGIQVDSLKGNAINAFQRTYSEDIARTIGGQRGLVTAAGLAITAEATAWNQALITLRDFIKKATYDFNNYAGTQAAKGDNVEATLGAVSAIAGLAGATVGVAFPPFGVAMGVVGGVAGVASLMFGGQEAIEAKPLALDFGSYTDCWESFKDGIVDIAQDLANAEVAIAEGCQRILADYHANPDNYSLTQVTPRSDGRGQQGPYDDLAPFMAVEVHIKYAEWNKVAGAVESIGDHQHALAGLLGGTDGAGDPSAKVLSEWSRGYLPEGGAIGNGGIGPYTSFSSVIETAIDLLLAESKTSHEVAQKCYDIGTDFKLTDNEIEAGLNEEAKKFDTVPIPQVNG